MTPPPAHAAAAMACCGYGLRDEVVADDLLVHNEPLVLPGRNRAGSWGRGAAGQPTVGAPCPQYTFKVVTAGQLGVGKTSLLYGDEGSLCLRGDCVVGPADPAAAPRAMRRHCVECVSGAASPHKLGAPASRVCGDTKLNVWDTVGERTSRLCACCGLVQCKHLTGWLYPAGMERYVDVLPDAYFRNADGERDSSCVYVAHRSLNLPRRCGCAWMSRCAPLLRHQQA